MIEESLLVAVVEKWRGKLRGKIVLTQPAREVRKAAVGAANPNDDARLASSNHKGHQGHKGQEGFAIDSFVSIVSLVSRLFVLLLRR